MRAHDFYSSLRCSAASVLVLAGAAFVVPAGPAIALSEIGDGTQIQPSATSPVQRAPLPSPDDSEGEQMMPAPPASDDNSEGAGEEEQNSPSAVHPRADPDEPAAEVIYDLGRLPEPVRRMHGLILEACKSGELEKLRPLIGTGETQTQLTLGDFEGDPITFIRELAGDDQGQEILAILQEILEAGYVHLDAGTPEELYVWPYFFALPLDKLTPPQRVELFRIVTAGDYEDMKVFGTYIFYRVGITPEGRWQFFVAGE